MVGLGAGVNSVGAVRLKEELAKELGVAGSSLNKWSKQYDSGKFFRDDK